MSDDPESIRSMRIRAAARRAAERERDTRAEKMKTAKDVADRVMADMPALAAGLGVVLDADGKVVMPADANCDVCRQNVTVERATSIDDMCDAHRAENAHAVAERVLRKVIPLDFHDAKPSHVKSDLRGWDGMDGTGLFLFGPVDTAKSHTAAALLKLAFARRYASSPEFPRPAWLNVPTAILETLAAFGKKRDPSPIWDNAMRATLLVIDDIGLEEPKGWVLTRLYGLIEYRLHHRLTTIITSNKNIDELAVHLGPEKGSQIASRIARICAQSDFNGQPNWRLSIAPTLPAAEK